MPHKTYTISDLSERTGLSIHTLRFYEKEGLLRHVERTKTGRRIYGDASIGTLMGILCLKRAGVTLPQIKEFFDETMRGPETLPHRLKMLEQAKAKLLAAQAEIEHGLRMAEFGIAGCRQALEALAQGKDPDTAAPFLTREGVVDIPFMKDRDGRLVPDAPPDVDQPQSPQTTP